MTTALLMVTLRPAKEDDAMLLFHWQRHPDTRRYARTPIAPSDADHSAWFADKLVDRDCRLFLAESGDDCVGMVRLDRRGKEWELSIVVAPEQRGRGIGKAILNALDGPGPLVAEVLPDNEASHRLFQSCGWLLCEDGLYRR